MTAPSVSLGKSDSREDLVDEQRREFAEHFGEAPAAVASAPGRLNVIGEHTDYSDGLALPAAVDRWAVVGLRPRRDDRVRVYSRLFEQTIEFGLDDADAGPGWARLPHGVARVWAEAFGTRTGFDAAIGGNVPRGAGVSSSAAVEMALFNALRAACEEDVADQALVRMGQRVEHEYMGVNTGLMDQYTSQCSRAGAVMLIDFRDLTHEYIDWKLAHDWAWLLLDSGVRHDLAASAYGNRVEEMKGALAAVAATAPEVRGFRDITDEHIDHLADPTQRLRARHYVAENDRVCAAAEALAAADAVRLGQLLVASHASLRDDYEVSCPELDALVEQAITSDDCAGARMLGGGFGGSVLTLVRPAALQTVVQAVSEPFEQRFGYAPGAAVYRLVGGADVH